MRLASDGTDGVRPVGIQDRKRQRLPGIVKPVEIPFRPNLHAEAVRHPRLRHLLRNAPVRIAHPDARILLGPLEIAFVSGDGAVKRLRDQDRIPLRRILADPHLGASRDEADDVRAENRAPRRLVQPQGDIRLDIRTFATGRVTRDQGERPDLAANGFDLRVDMHGVCEGGKRRQQNPRKCQSGDGALAGCTHWTISISPIGSYAP